MAPARKFGRARGDERAQSLTMGIAIGIATGAGVEVALVVGIGPLIGWRKKQASGRE
jgi:hypothetical protein